MTAIPAFSIAVGDMRIQAGCVAKTSTEVKVDFAEKFDHPPVVVLSSFWGNSGNEVGHAETLDTIADDHFVATSNNASSTYFVSWLAVGSRDDVALPDLPAVTDGDLLLQFGRINRTRPTLWSIPFPTPYPDTPSLLVSPLWERQHSGVGHAETIVALNPLQAAVLSANSAANFFTTWIAAGSASGNNRDGGFPVGDGFLIQTGQLPKRGRGLTVSFKRPFTAPPVVIVAPFWPGGAVGHAETLQTVDARRFSLISGNAAPDYSVCFLAIGLA